MDMQHKSTFVHKYSQVIEWYRGSIQSTYKLNVLGAPYSFQSHTFIQYHVGIIQPNVLGLMHKNGLKVVL